MQRSEMPQRQSTPDQHAPPSGRSHLDGLAPLLALGVFLLVFLVALGSSRSLGHVGGAGSLTRERLIIGNVIFLLVAIAAIPALLYVVWQMLEMNRDETGHSDRMARSEKRMLKLVIGLALVGGVIATLMYVRPGDTRTRAPTPPGATARPTTTHQVKDSQQVAQTLAPWIAGTAGLAVVSLLAAAWIARRRRSGFPVGELAADELEAPRSELHEQVGISIGEIERESDPRRAVIRAYAGMESTLSRHELGRRPFEAPGEYLSRAFGALRLSRRPGRRLTELFERARFSQHAIDPEMKRESIAALGELRDELEAKPR